MCFISHRMSIICDPVNHFYLTSAFKFMYNMYVENKTGFLFKLVVFYVFYY